MDRNSLAPCAKIIIIIITSTSFVYYNSTAKVHDTTLSFFNSKDTKVNKI